MRTLGLLLMGFFLIYAGTLIVLGQEKKKSDTTKVEVTDKIKPEIARATQLVKRQIKTRYDINGRAVNQSQDAKGHHRVVGSCTLSSGVDTVSLNTSTADGKNDISFISSSTFSGRVWSANLANRSKTYSIMPLSGTKFVVVSSDTSDTAAVQFVVEGE